MIYADFNATTPLSKGAIMKMEEGFTHWGNPSSSHQIGRKASEIIEESRRVLAEKLGVSPLEIVFTSGGSEANTSVLLGSFYLIGPGFKLLTSGLEHSSVKDSLPLIEKLGGEVKKINCLPSGQIDYENLEKEIQHFQPHLVSLMSVNNETGVIFDTKRIYGLCQNLGISFHTDAIQALGKLSTEKWLSADFITLSAHKIGGPKGIGALIIKNKKLLSTHYGGSQEVKRRGGTQNVLGILGFAGAIQSLECFQKEKQKNKFEEKIKMELPDISIQGSESERIGNTSNIHFPGIGSEVLLGSLDLEGISVSAGSACSSGSISPSHVLLAMGLSEQKAKECIRFSFSNLNSDDDFIQVAQRVIFHVKRIRERRKDKPYA